ncbi:hypothetical protein E3U40_10065 [Campylobacter fetus subsp. venerealis]|uniref:hypothetical protein n=1 Tax=Pseudomonadati TaxID=3379134 RepID=UPI0003D7BFC0|nr:MULTISPECIES: hypothetical protein [Bacteria]AHE95223.1 hypothetical protein CFVI03293_A0098 [Campylobacter fetus subsp. venerealis cfvi03/293]KAA3682624.1 hypothetical protein E3U40_10065 [Campylobacter fetus subsp. venerealis]OCS20471.1 hypothetical protein CFVI97532_10020 [Campylobacter fetus subsp. venerealis cfvi97/532]CUA64589.1 Uncharacterised protein [Escherichia coli]
MKKSLFFVSILCLGTLAFGADEFAGISDIVTSGDTSARTTAKIGLAWALSLVFPIIMIAFGLGHAYHHLKQKSEQQPSTGKIIGTLIGGVIIYGFTYVLAVAIFSRILTGDMATWFDTINNFWIDLSK